MNRMHAPVFRCAGQVMGVAAVLAIVQQQLQPDRARSDTDSGQGYGQGYGHDSGLAEALESAIEEYRYERDLVSAEECEGWLAARGLAYTDLQSSLARRLAGASATDPEQQRIDLLVSSDFDAASRALAYRMAALAVLDRAPPVNGDAEGHPMLDAAFADCTRHALTESARRRMHEHLRWPLTAVGLEAVEFDQPEAAREARCCVEEDGLALGELARREGYPTQMIDARIESLPDAWQQLLASPPPNGLIGPLLQDGRHWLLQLQRRQPPVLDDAAVRRRVEQQLLGTHYEALLAQHVEWIMPVLEVPFVMAEQIWASR